MSDKKKNIIVTGASRGLGKAICKLLSQWGHQVLATARSEHDLSKLWNDDPNVRILACDLCDSDAATKIVSAAKEFFGSLDGLVNNAGTIEPILPLASAPGSDWARAITLNLTAPTLLMKEALPHLQKSRGRVVNISTGAAVKVVQGWSAYCASKAGLLHLTEVAAAENPDIAFFSLRPGVIDTDMQGEIRNSSGMSASDLQKFQDLKANNELEDPIVPARSAAWLVLSGPLERSGEFIQYTDEHVLAGLDLLAGSR